MEAEAFCAMEGIDVQITSDSGGGDNVGWIHEGDWLEYEVSVPSGGVYEFSFRVASPNSGTQITVSTRQESESSAALEDLGSVAVPNTGDWQSWQTVSGNFVLQEGVQLLRLEFSGGSSGLLNLNWIEGITVTTSLRASASEVNSAREEGYSVDSRGRYVNEKLRKNGLQVFSY
jgi:hypothetical protein